MKMGGTLILPSGHSSKTSITKSLLAIQNHRIHSPLRDFRECNWRDGERLAIQTQGWHRQNKGWLLYWQFFDYKLVLVAHIYLHILGIGHLLRLVIIGLTQTLIPWISKHFRYYEMWRQV